MSLSLRGLRVTYPGITAVDAVDLDLARGEVVALLGASGSGKSSLLRAVAGLEEVACGTITWDGRDVVGVPVHRRGFGLMFQDGQLFPFRDVAGNVAYGLAGMSRARRKQVVMRMLELVGLPGFEPRDVTTLSGGQAQRVALARALAPNPRLLLLDEPLSALDRALREQLAVDVRAILHQEGTTALYVTHDQDEAMTVADRVGIMESGRLLRLDTPERLWADPGSAAVARFLGFGPLLSRQEAARLGWDGVWLRSGAAGPGGAAPDGGGVGADGTGAFCGAPPSGTAYGAAGDRLVALAPGALSAVAPSEAPGLPRARVRALRVRRGQRLVEVDLLGHAAVAGLDAGPAAPVSAWRGGAEETSAPVEPGDEVALVLDVHHTVMVPADG